MKENVKFYGSILILIIFIPYLITVYLHGGSFALFSQSGEDEQFEQEVLSALAAEMSADYDLECLKAQAVIARTNLYREEDGETSDSEEVGKTTTSDSAEAGDSSENHEGEAGEKEKQDSVEDTDIGWSENQMKAAWGDAYEENLKKLENAVSETAGEILTYEGEPILAAFHTACNGKTRNATEVPGQETYTYLMSVASEDDILADGFLSISFMEKADFAAALQNVFSGECLDAEQLPGALSIVERDSADYVTRVQYGATIVSGEAVREALGLQSACFYLSELDGKIRIVTKGIGHGLGFSQYGAEQLAKKGYDYRELLTYYFPDVDLGQK